MTPITSIEYDQRLINGFEYNCFLNSIPYCTTTTTPTPTTAYNSSSTATSTYGNRKNKNKSNTTNDVSLVSSSDMTTKIKNSIPPPIKTIVNADAGRWCRSYIAKLICKCTEDININKNNNNPNNSLTKVVVDNNTIQQNNNITSR